jgi:hypothetical protein
MAEESALAAWSCFIATLSRHRAQSPSGESPAMGVPHWVHGFMLFSTPKRSEIVWRLQREVKPNLLNRHRKTTVSV